MCVHVWETTSELHVEDRGQLSGVGSLSLYYMGLRIQDCRPRVKCPYSLSLSLALVLMVSIKVLFFVLVRNILLHVVI